MNQGPAFPDTALGAPGRPGPARIGIGGPVGSGKTALIEALIPVFRARGIELAVVTNDLVTKEDARRLQAGGLIAPERVVAVEAGACPHTVIREDPTLNIAAADDLEARFPELDLILIESGGDNLASTFSLDLVDWWMFVIDVGQGDDIPRKRGPGILQVRPAGAQQAGPGAACLCRCRGDAGRGADNRGDRPVIGCRCKGAPPRASTDIADTIARDLLFREAAS